VNLKNFRAHAHSLIQDEDLLWNLLTSKSIFFKNKIGVNDNFFFYCWNLVNISLPSETRVEKQEK
jgi:hypothetical protein